MRRFTVGVAISLTLTASVLRAATMTVDADRIVTDNVTKSATATGHIHATCGVLTLRGESMKRDADGVMRFENPTYVTTCTNQLGHTHWNATGEIEYQSEDHVFLKNMWLTFYEIPIFYLPYFYYPLGTECGFSWMPGYTGRWGAFLLTKYSYHLVGDRAHQDNTWWLKGDTRFDLRYKNGVALGESLYWNLGDFGNGQFKIYYAWDDDIGSNSSHGSRHSGNWGSDIDKDRYGMSLKHRWEPTERDAVWIKGTVYSDSYFCSDFMRKTFFSNYGQWLGHSGNGVFWEHLENAFAFGVETSGPINDFYGGTGRLPEFYFDLMPRQLLEFPVNFESENRFGYLRRQSAEYGSNNSVYSHNPGYWANYDTFRFDTYDRLSAPVKFADDVIAVVPRMAYRGTYWEDSGDTLVVPQYDTRAGENSRIYRSIIEGGITFSARGTAWLSGGWQHFMEPYFDTLAQEARYSGRESGSRPYIFDNLDASVIWEDQFAGRGRNLPYSYYGVTPGLRNGWSKLQQDGFLKEIVDLDAYMAIQFGSTDWEESGLISSYDKSHKLAKVGQSNYGQHDIYATPGARLKWKPDDDIRLLTAAEYDPDNNRLALGEVVWTHRLTKDFRYNASYRIRDYRIWDFASSPYDPSAMSNDEFNWTRFQVAEIGFTQQPIDWFAWSPFVRWDLREDELDSIGTWFDFLTDCLGFRFIVSYDNSYRRIDGTEYDDDFSVGFYVYLRAFGDGGNIFK